MIQDAQGHHLSGATEAAVTGYDQAVRAFNLVHGDSIGLFDAAREAAPDFAMAYLGKAWVFAVANDPGLLAQARTLVEAVRSLPLNEREQAHLAALSHLVRGARSAAVAVMDRHLMHYPFDLLAHQARRAELRRFDRVGLSREASQEVGHRCAEAACGHQFESVRAGRRREGQRGD